VVVRALFRGTGRLWCGRDGRNLCECNGHPRGATTGVCYPNRAKTGFGPAGSAVLGLHLGNRILTREASNQPAAFDPLLAMPTVREPLSMSEPHQLDH
jgi:hypothetical protein